ncbi:DNA polymerase III, delta subunit [Thermodesulfatator indicus DSM 15286]|uniref:DNA-directed DNA polymerase n=1 Tax=Thermodesulfatator indicus (strain DSM 15286 / JCM 11887 / CIR29812) TaxID=667014 RepID=F8A8E9_THEID|nr:DNA polymerase III subunit delta [Thermodesulfatator indicus]AEH43953.1 DNA polymerase III, delta subunit [Thermodesulfatator indicus DSM 15286]
MPVFKRHHFERLFKLAQEGRIAPLYLFLGNPQTGEELARRLFEFLKKQGFQAEKLKASETNQLREKLFSPFLFGRRVFFLEVTKDTLNFFDEKTLSFLEQNKTRLSLIISINALDEKHPLYKYAQERAVIMPLSDKKSKDLLSYEIPELLASFGKKMDRAAAESLLALVGEDLGAIRQEIEKLSLFVGERPVITLADVKEVVSPRPEQAPYILTQTLFQEGPEAALKFLQNLLIQGIHPLVILATFTKFFKRLYLLREVFEANPDLASIKNFKVFQEKYKKTSKEVFPDKEPKDLKGYHPYAIFMMRKPASLLVLDDFSFIFEELAKIDLALKTGALPEENFYSFFVKLKLKIKKRLKSKTPHR